jgi:hypothetical protein
VQTYKTLLQNQGARLRILVLRENKPVMITMKVRSIL